MALTLVEAAKLNSGDVVKSAVIEMFARQSDILAALPFEDIPGGAVKYNREQTLPGIAFRGVNESYTASTGVLNPIVDSVVIAGGDLDVDRFIVQTQGQQQRSVQEEMKVKSLADSWTTKFIKGDSTSDPREFDGLQARLTGAQLIENGNTSGGDVLSLANLDAAIDAVDNPTHILMSKAMRRLLTAAARTYTVAGYVTYSQDSFGRRQTMYNDLPIIVAYSNNGGTEPLGFTEAGGGGGTTSTSIYVLSLGPGRLVGIQNGGMDVRDLGELQTAPVYRTRVEWYAGLALYHGRAAARLRGVKTGAVVA
jgi:hypothetical protein